MAGHPRITPSDETIAQMWLDSNSLTEVGEKLGISRQFVEQCRNRVHPRWLISLHKQRIAARFRLGDYVRNGQPRTLRDCAVCGHAFAVNVNSRLPRLSCSPEHRRIWRTLRPHLPVLREARYIRQARRTLVADPDPIKRRSAQRVLDGTVNTHGRWLQHGSNAHHAATLAAANGWPIFDSLPEPIQAQIRIKALQSAG